MSQLAATGPDALDALKLAIAKATALQNRAIGRGLYQTVDFCLATGPSVSARVQKMVASLANKDVTDSYAMSKSIAAANAMVTPFSASAAVDRTAVVGLVGQPTLNNAGSLTLSDPFGSPDDWK